MPHPQVNAGLNSILDRVAIINDDGLSSSGIYMTAKEFKTIHPWHQDASDEFSAYGACVWVTMTECGVDAPGLAFATRNPGRRLSQEEVEEYVKTCPIISPVYRPGDSVFFDNYSLHATHRTPFKLVGTREGTLRATPAPLEDRPLGHSDLYVSALGLGCAGFGRKTARGGGLDFAGAREVVEAALDAGVTLFDTADIYGDGDSEELLGRLLKERRKDVVISTKWGGAPPSRPDVAWGSAAYIREALEGRLRRLQTDYIDLYHGHCHVVAPSTQ